MFFLFASLFKHLHLFKNTIYNKEICVLLCRIHIAFYACQKKSFKVYSLCKARERLNLPGWAHAVKRLETTVEAH